MVYGETVTFITFYSNNMFVLLMKRLLQLPMQKDLSPPVLVFQ